GSDFANQAWHGGAGEALRRQPGPGRPFHWSPAYYKPQIEEVVISISTPLRDARNRHAGLAVIDWRADEIIRLVSGVRVTPGTFAFLLDRENRNLSSLAEANDEDRAQRLMERIIGLQLQRSGELDVPPPELDPK